MKIGDIVTLSCIGVNLLGHYRVVEKMDNGQYRLTGVGSNDTDSFYIYEDSDKVTACPISNKQRFFPY